MRQTFIPSPKHMVPHGPGHSTDVAGRASVARKAISMSGFRAVSPQLASVRCELSPQFSLRQTNRSTTLVVVRCRPPVVRSPAPSHVVWRRARSTMGSPSCWTSAPGHPGRGGGTQPKRRGRKSLAKAPGLDSRPSSLGVRLEKINRDHGATNRHNLQWGYEN